jgi:hypothetical protein
VHISGPRRCGNCGIKPEREHNHSRTINLMHDRGDNIAWLKSAWLTYLILGDIEWYVSNEDSRSFVSRRQNGLCGLCSSSLDMGSSSGSDSASCLRADRIEEPSPSAILIAIAAILILIPFRIFLVLIPTIVFTCVFFTLSTNTFSSFSSSVLSDSFSCAESDGCWAMALTDSL